MLPLGMLALLPVPGAGKEGRKRPRLERRVSRMKMVMVFWPVVLTKDWYL